MFTTRAGREECGRCGRSGAVGEGRVEPSEGRWLCSQCSDRLSGPTVQRASTDTGRKRGAHSIILRELGWLQSHHEAHRSDKRQRASSGRTDPEPPSARADEAAAKAAAPTPKPAARSNLSAAAALAPSEQLLAAIRGCPTHRPGSAEDEGGRSATAAAIALVDALREALAQLSPESLREVPLSLPPSLSLSLSLARSLSRALAADGTSDSFSLSCRSSGTPSTKRLILCVSN